MAGMILGFIVCGFFLAAAAGVAVAFAMDWHKDKDHGTKDVNDTQPIPIIPSP